MKGNTHGSLGHRQPLGSLRYGGAFDGNGPDGIPLSLWQSAKMAVHIGNEHGWLTSLSCQNPGKVLKRKCNVPPAPAQRVNDLMACDGPEPRADWRILIPALPLEVDRKQRFLHDVLCICISRPAKGEAPPGQSAKPRRQKLKQTAIGLRVARQARAHQLRPLFFPLIPAHNGPDNSLDSAAACLALRRLRRHRDHTFLIEDPGCRR